MLDPAALARWVWYAGLFGAIGAAGIRIAGFRGTAALPDAAAFRQELNRAARLLGLIGIALIGAGEIGRLYLQARGFLDPGEPGTIDQVRVILVATKWGTGWTAQVYVAVLGGIGLVLASRRSAAGWSLTTVAAVGLAVTAPLTGHALDSPWPAPAAIGLQALHVLGGSLWLGTLLGLATAGWRALSALPVDQRNRALAQMVDAFSPLALIGASGTLVCGVALGWVYIGSWHSLFHTAYGQVLLVKLGLLGIVAGLGAIHWRQTRPALRTAGGAPGFRRSMLAELAAAALLLGATAILSGLAAPRL